MKDFESIKDDFIEKYWERYCEDYWQKFGPKLMSILLHGLLLLMLLYSAKIIIDDNGEPARYISIKIGNPYRSDYNNAYLHSPEMDSKIAQQQDFQQEIAEQIEQTKIEPINLPKPIKLPQKQQKFKLEVKENQANPAASQPSEANGQKNGNANKGQDSATYLEWLQLTVQETSRIPIQAREQGISGSAVLRLSFDRDGYVHDFRLVRPTGNRILDAAALRVARKLTFEPFPPMPPDFEQGRAIVTYDFPISFKP